MVAGRTARRTRHDQDAGYYAGQITEAVVEFAELYE
jgi:hypothetical protein